MADSIVQVQLQGITGLPEDRYVNTLAFQGDDFDSGKADELWDKFNTFTTQHGGGLAAGPHWIKAYHMGAQPQGPYFSKSYDRGVGLSGQGPAEVALCLSYASVDDPEQSLPRRRGRIYLGPFQGTETNKERPSPTLLEHALDLGEGIAQVGLASNLTWAIHSRTDGVLAKIESIWVDDAWDTQRRRGLSPLAKTVRDVQ